ncbi:hypothetical protein [Streptomyces clavifer]
MVVTGLRSPTERGPVTATAGRPLARIAPTPDAVRARLTDYHHDPVQQPR